MAPLNTPPDLETQLIIYTDLMATFADGPLTRANLCQIGAFAREVDDLARQALHEPDAA